MRFLKCCLPLLFLTITLCDPLRAAERNILVIITDDESPTLGCYGDSVARTPAIDAVAADGMVFTNAFATTASCSASRSVVLSGLYNHKNGQFGHQHDFHHFTTFRDVAALTMPRTLAAAGYRTGQCGKLHVGPEPVYQFETYIADAGRNVVAMAENCREFLTADDQRPFLLYFATHDPHRGGPVDADSQLELKPNLFGNLPHDRSFPRDRETFYNPADVPVPPFLTDNPETREELAQYYQSCSRVDRGVERLVAILREAGLYDKTLIVFTSDHGMAFSGAKTAVYEASLRVPMVVRDPYQKQRGQRCDAMIAHIDLTPTLLDFAGGLDREKNAPAKPVDMSDVPTHRGENTHGPFQFDRYDGQSWLPLLADPSATIRDELFASHTFHEIQMYYPMRVVRTGDYKLIWNIAHPLPYPFASDLWVASSWQSQYRQGLDAPYGGKTVGEFIHRPEFELYDVRSDPHEINNLADEPAFATVLEDYKERLETLQKKFEDPWIMKWEYE